MKKAAVILLLGIVLITGKAFAASSYKIDPVHSSLGFSVIHMMVSKVTGQFDQYEGTIIYDPNDLAHSQISVTVQASSINTHEPKRDGHLRSSDFFDVAQFPVITFTSKKITPDFIIGDLTMKGVTKEISVPGTILGPVKTSPDSLVIGISGSFKLNRQDYGIKWNKMLDQGGVAISDEVTVNVNLEAQKKESSTQPPVNTNKIKAEL